jgi:hypothetical protein
MDRMHVFLMLQQMLHIVTNVLQMVKYKKRNMEGKGGRITPRERHGLFVVWSHSICWQVIHENACGDCFYNFLLTVTSTEQNYFHTFVFTQCHHLQLHQGKIYIACGSRFMWQCRVELKIFEEKRKHSVGAFIEFTEFIILQWSYYENSQLYVTIKTYYKYCCHVSPSLFCLLIHS